MAGEKFNYEQLFDTTSDLLCIAGFDGYFKRVNPAVIDLLGYPEDEVYARPINEFVYEEDRDITANVRRDLTESIPLHNFENRYVTKSGDIVWLTWTSQPVENEEFIFAIAKNITHKKRLEKERAYLIKNLNKINKDFTELSLTTSHDLRSPLSSFQSVFDFIDVSEINNEETLKFINLLKLTGKMLRETLDDFVDQLSMKIDARQKLGEVDLQQALDAVTKSIQSLIKTSGCTIHADFSDQDVVRFNQEYMESVFLNLITNAIKYSKPYKHPVIRISSKRQDGVTRLELSDNGLGLDLGKVGKKIFGLNQTFHDHDESKGIGLYLVHNHITSLGGKIEVESELGQGTTFMMYFNE